MAHDHRMSDPLPARATPDVVMYLGFHDSR